MLFLLFMITIPTFTVIDDKVIEKERENDFQLSSSKKFKYRTKYFTDSWIIGSKEYVSSNYQVYFNYFMHIFNVIRIYILLP